MKTYDEWLKTDEFLVDWLEPGDEVDQAMVDNLRETQRLKQNWPEYIQVDGIVGYWYDIRGNRWPLYMSFYTAGERWIYSGPCLSGGITVREVMNG